MPQTIYPYTSKRTGKTYEIPWAGVNPPSQTDFNTLEQQILDSEDQQSRQTTTTTPKPPEIKPPDAPTIGSRAMEMVGGLASGMRDSTLLNPFKQAKLLVNPIGYAKDEIGSFKNQQDQFMQGARESEHPWMYTGKKVAEAVGLPISNLQEDLRTGAAGAGILDSLQAIGTIAGAHSALTRGISPSLLPKTAKVPVVPPVSEFTNLPKVEPPVWDFEKPTIQPPEPHGIPRSQGIQTISPGTVENTPPPTGRTVSGNKPLWDLRLPKDEPVPPRGEVRPSGIEPGKFSEIKVEYEDPLTKELKTRVDKIPEDLSPDALEAWKRKKTAGAGRLDYVSDPILSHVPDRLRPEVPNVTNLKATAEGVGRAGTVEKPPVGSNVTPGGKFQFVNEADYLAQRDSLPNQEPGTPNVDPIEAAKKEIPKPDEAPPQLKGSYGILGVKNFLKNNPTLKAAYEKWVNSRAASPHIANKINDMFKDTLGGLTKDDVVQFQKDVEAGNHPAVRDFFDKLHAEMTAKGIPVDYKYNYLPQLWEQTPEVVKQVLGEKRLSTKASFTMRSVFADYATGVEKGLTPKMSPLELMKWYGERSNTLMADTDMWNHLKENDLVKVRGTKGSAGLPVLDPNLLPGNWGVKSLEGSGTLKGANYTAQPAVKAMLENYLGKGGNGIGSFLGKVGSRMTGLALAAGVPEVPLLQFHGINTLVNAVMEGGLKRGVTAIKAGLPHFDEHFNKYFADNRDVTIQAVKDGLNIKNPDSLIKPAFADAANPVTKSLNWADNISSKYFKKPLFDQMIPKIMIEAYKDRVSKGISGAQAADDINRTYGHLNFDAMGRSKEFQNFAKAVGFAPAWVESRAKMLNMKNKVNQVAAGRALMSYAAANMINMGASGHPMWNNDLGHEYDIYAGKRADGSTRYISLSNAFDQYKVPLELGSDIVKDKSLKEAADVVKNKTSVPIKLGLDLVSGFDRQGNPLITTGQDKWGNKVSAGRRLANTFADVSSTTMPSLVKSGINFAAERDPEKALMEATQLPVRYKMGRSQKPTGMNINLPGINIPALGKKPKRNP
jgi:hypothetical protein